MLKLLQIGLGFIPLLIGIAGLFLSSWIVLTAPVLSLYPLSVGAAEVSPWLFGLNAIAVFSSFWLRSGWVKWGALGCGCLGLLLSCLPLVQLPATHQQAVTEMERNLRKDYLSNIPKPLQTKLRAQSFVLTDAFKGIALDSVRVTTDVQFAAPDGIPLSLDVYRPAQVGTYPGVVMIHGGAWRSGSPKDNAEFNRYLAAQGYTVIAISYRLAPQHPFPAQLEDVQAAIAFIQQHATQYELDLNRMVIMGRSAGGHLAKLVAYQPNAYPFKAVVSYYGPIDLTKGYYDLPVPDPINVRAVLEAFLAGTPDTVPAQYQQASPASFLRRNLPPTLLIYAGRDHIMKATFGRQLADQLRSLGNTAVYIEIPWAEHAFDAIFNGVSNQLALYHTERFLAWATREGQ
ncbi:MAG: alpha/beta hydrolase [Oscillatoriales cyanobacterium C42_A2020_001]|nr:alpha/beta hydrolase [Leptolyngbyaceae cyanobacterium C42_A2020_001]